MEYIEINHLHAVNQSAYRPNHSCETAMVHVTDEIQNSLSKKHNVLLVLLDLSAAFDTVDHQLLFDRLEAQYNIQDDALSLLKSYLDRRKFSVVIDEYKSEPHKLFYGVPQGSILAPQLYSLYTRNIETIAEKHGVNVHLYADDCSIYIPFEEKDVATTKNRITKCIADVKEWMGKSYLKLNENKTKIMLLKPKGPKSYSVNSFQLNLDGNMMEEETTVKLLGVQLDPNLNFSKFINKKISNCNFHLRNLRAIKNSIPQKTRIILVTSLICSTLDYCNALLICVPKYSIDLLQKVLNKAVRFIYDVRSKDHITPYLYKLHIYQ